MSAPADRAAMLAEIGAELNALLRRAGSMQDASAIEALVRVSQGRGEELVEVDGELKPADEHMAEHPELRVLANRLNALWQ